MPEGYPWGFNFGTGHRHNVSGIQATTTEIPTLQASVPIPQQGVTFSPVTMSVSQPLMTVTTPVVHTIPFGSNEVYHDDNMDPGGRMEDLQEKFNQMQREIKALRGKDLFGKNAHDLCLVPSIRIPAKFKVPDFENTKVALAHKVIL